MFLRGPNIDVLPGTFLLAKSQEYQDRLIVCQLVQVLAPPNILVFWWLEDDLLRGIIADDQRQSLTGLESYSNLSRCNLKEVTKQAFAQEIDSANVQDIAFVFHADDLESQWVNCAGMKKVFFTRYELTGDGNLVELAYAIHMPFTHGLLESYPSRIWYSLMFLKEKIAHLMNKRTQQQVCRSSANVFLSLEAWEYLCRQFNSVIAPLSFSKERSKPCQFCNLSLETRTVTATFMMLRIATPASMDRAREVFGTTFGVGCRNMPPLKGQMVRQLVHGDIVNLVNVSCIDNNNLQLQGPKVKEFIAAQRVDLVYESAKRQLSIRTKYSRVNAEDALVLRFLNWLPASTANTQPSTNARRRPIAVGTNFMFHGNLVKVVNSTSDYVIIRDVDSGIEESLATNSARQLIRQYIGF